MCGMCCRCFCSTPTCHRHSRQCAASCPPAMQQALPQLCLGKLSVQFPPSGGCMRIGPDWDGFAAWLMKRAALLKHVDLDLGSSEASGPFFVASLPSTSYYYSPSSFELKPLAAALPQEPDNATNIAAALRATAARSQQLRLKSFAATSSPSSSSSVAGQLGQLPAASLTHLALNFIAGSGLVPEDFTAISQALSGLTGLHSVSLSILARERRLHVYPDGSYWNSAWGAPPEDGEPSGQHHRETFGGAGPMLEALPALQLLTKLGIGQLASVDCLQHLPGQLLELRVQLSGNAHTRWVATPGWSEHIQYSPPLEPFSKEPAPLNLVHLTALTKLELTGDHNEEGTEWQVLEAADKLPPALRSLSLLGCSIVDPILQLSSLQDLNVGVCSVPASALLQLGSSCTQLRSISMCYTSAAAVNAAAAGWHAVPVQRLTISCEWYMGCYLSAATIRQLAMLQGMQELGVTDSIATGPSQLAATLQQLTQLERVSLWVSLQQEQWKQQDVQAAAQQAVGDGMVQLAQALAAGSSRLRKLAFKGRLNGIALGSAAVHLAAATQLTSLQLSGCSLSDDHIGKIIQCMSGLRELDLDSNPELTDACMPAIAQLKQLRCLRLSGTGVTDAGMALLWLLQLEQPQRLTELCAPVGVSEAVCCAGPEHELTPRNCCRLVPQTALAVMEMRHMYDKARCCFSCAEHSEQATACSRSTVAAAASAAD